MSGIRQTLMHPRAVQPGQLRSMDITDLDAVMDIERSAYAFPWTRGNFVDSVAACYRMMVLRREDSKQIIGYYVGMLGVQEMHLLNVTVAPSHQSQGWGVAMLDDLCSASRSLSASKLWLEVRRSNGRALQLYERYGFQTVGMRKAYYPAPLGQREDALVMSLSLIPEAA